LHSALTHAKSGSLWVSLFIATLVSVLALLLLSGSAFAQDITEPEALDEPFTLLDHPKPEVDHSVRPPNLGLELYIVVSGDTLSGIAETFDLKQKTIIWANPALQDNPERLSIDQELWIPPIDSALHTIESGDNLIAIARQYGVSVEDITDCYYNPLIDPRRLKVGEQILVPGASRAVHQPQQTHFHSALPADAPVGAGEIIWPVSGYITQGCHTGHYALDIGSWTGKPIVAADDGFVIRAGWDDTGYGFVIVIDHGNGMKTLYAHLNDFRVEAGEAVSRGDAIGLMGKTGNTTGTHLHFEVIVNNMREDPSEYLP
jgi:murein DD-endopeptidase MepM/ murein hydrolase activator NlpD